MASYRITVTEYLVEREGVTFTCSVQRLEGQDWVTIAERVRISLSLIEVQACVSLAEVRALLVAEARRMAVVRRQSVRSEILDRLPELPVTIDIGEV